MIIVGSLLIEKSPQYEYIYKVLDVQDKWPFSPAVQYSLKVVKSSNPIHHVGYLFKAALPRKPHSNGSYSRGHLFKILPYTITIPSVTIII